MRWGKTKYFKIDGLDFKKETKYWFVLLSNKWVKIFSKVSMKRFNEMYYRNEITEIQNEK